MVSEMMNPWKIETRQINDSVLLRVSMNTNVMRNTARASLSRAERYSIFARAR